MDIAQHVLNIMDIAHYVPNIVDIAHYVLKIPHTGDTESLDRWDRITETN